MSTQLNDLSRPGLVEEIFSFPELDRVMMEKFSEKYNSTLRRKLYWLNSSSEEVAIAQ